MTALEKRAAANRRAAVLASSQCPSCIAGTRHAREDWQEHHPWAGHGVNGASGCQCGDAACPYARTAA